MTDAREAMERAVERLPSEYLENYVDNYERGNVGRVERFGGWDSDCCAIACMSEPDRRPERVSGYDEVKDGPYSDHATAVEHYFEDCDWWVSTTRSPAKRARAADIYTTCTLELTRRKGLRTLPPARTEPAEVA